MYNHIFYRFFCRDKLYATNYLAVQEAGVYRIRQIDVNDTIKLQVKKFKDLKLKEQDCSVEFYTAKESTGKLQYKEL